MSTTVPATTATAPVQQPTGGTGARPRVVVVGSGFGGLEAAKRLGKLSVEVLLIDRHNYHLFQPLLYQVATAGLEPEEVAHPVRSILRGQHNVRFLVTEVRQIDLAAGTVQTEAGMIAYDYLILGAGSTNTFFGMQSLEKGAHGLKDIDEAMALRNRILSRFEAAAWERNPERRRALLTFVIVGGGPTGVEFAGALRELVGHVLPHDFPSLDFHEVRVILVEASDRLLAMLASKLQRYALETLREKGVDVRLNTAVERLEGERLYLKGGEQIEAGTVMWAAGVRAEDLATRIQAPRGRQDRIAVLPTLQLADHPEVFVIGDMAAVQQDGAVLPMLAPVAQQEARWAAANIGRLVRGEAALPFRYRDKGTMATIGRQAAVAQIGPLKFTGFFAWLLWLGLHIVLLIGFRNRLLVLINWAWDYCFYDRAVRLILSAPDEQARKPADPP